MICNAVRSVEHGADKCNGSLRSMSSCKSCSKVNVLYSAVVSWKYFKCQIGMHESRCAPKAYSARLGRVTLSAELDAVSAPCYTNRSSKAATPRLAQKKRDASQMLFDSGAHFDHAVACKTRGPRVHRQLGFSAETKRAMLALLHVGSRPPDTWQPSSTTAVKQ